MHLRGEKPERILSPEMSWRVLKRSPRPENVMWRPEDEKGSGDLKMGRYKRAQEDPGTSRDLD